MISSFDWSGPENGMTVLMRYCPKCNRNLPADRFTKLYFGESDADWCDWCTRDKVECAFCKTEMSRHSIWVVCSENKTVKPVCKPCAEFFAGKEGSQNEETTNVR
jgi:hypothetical protein